LLSHILLAFRVDIKEVGIFCQGFGKPNLYWQITILVCLKTWFYHYYLNSKRIILLDLTVKGRKCKISVRHASDYEEKKIPGCC